MNETPSGGGAAGEGGAGDLDYSSQPADSVIPQAEAGPPYDPRPGEDDARRNIAYSLIALLALSVLLIFKLLRDEVILVADVKEFSPVLGPLITLLSAATGFYYGTKSSKP